MRKKQYLIISIFMIIIFTLGACGSKSSYNETADTTTESGTVSKEESTNEENYVEPSPKADEAVEELKSEDKAINGGMDNSTGTANQELSADQLKEFADSRKYIRTFQYYIETLVFDETAATLEKLVNLNFGFFERTAVSGRTIKSTNSVNRQGSYTIRIPKEKIDAFLVGLEGIGNVLDSSSNVDDVTSQYYDIEARIKTLKVQEERLIAILEKADELKYILELERELSDVRYSIESYTTRMRDLDSRVNYSTINVQLYEVIEETEFKEPPKGFYEKMTTGFMDSVERVIDFLQELALSIITNIPALVLLAVFVLIIYMIVRRILRPRRLKKKTALEMKDEANKKEN